MNTCLVGLVLFCLSSCLLLIFSIRDINFAAQSEAWDVHESQSSYRGAPVPVRVYNVSVVHVNALSMFSINVTNADLDNMEVVCILLNFRCYNRCQILLW